ncbi:hypothetical protein PGO_134770 [Plasmodium gonderi]|uniref:Variable surface protein n=1 Tax=Plasmodium gonderi TaxID=77519 RepID=A0A1Y1JP39_PLAGO|nr:hypothetical protein PGO_134770 [Plasmodium gonderi]GAW83205.1 hypothetical protein PGO_134770 [Plasmodium gonderi]
MKNKKKTIHIKIFTLILLTCIYSYSNESHLGKYLCNKQYDNNVLCIKKERLLASKKKKGSEYKKEKLKCNLESSPKNKTTGNNDDVTSKSPKKKKINNKDLKSKTPVYKSAKGSDTRFDKKSLNHQGKLDKFNKNGKTFSNTSKRSAHTTYSLCIFLCLIILSVVSSIPIWYFFVFKPNITNDFGIHKIIGISAATFVILLIILVSLVTPTWANVSKCLRLNKGKQKN